MANFESDWRRFYPHAEPLGWMMRNAKTQHWVRFHSLPESKRYAESDAERQILLYRQNTLANDVLGEHNYCWLVQSFGEPTARSPAQSAHDNPLSLWPEYQFEFAYRFLDEEGSEFELPWNVNASLQVWENGAFDNLLWAVANEEALPTLWMSQSTGSVFAPYDGGVDLFLQGSIQVQASKMKHRDWLSSHPEGL